MDQPQSSQQSQLSGVMRNNIGKLIEVRLERERQENFQAKLADQISAFAGSMWFVYIHAAVLIFWLTANTGHVPGVKEWDPYPFVMLAMAASVEAIFLSTFVLISQNRMQATADRRADLDLQVNLLAEHEITRMIQMVELLCHKLEIEIPFDDLVEIKKDIAPEAVVEELEKVELEQAER